MDIAQPEAQRASQIAGAAMARSAEFQNIVFPKRIASPLLCRYDKDMNYGAHANSPMIPLPNGPLRSDVSGTLFIADPSTYEGGELVIHLGTETIKIKGEPGSMVVYPSTTLHEVAPVMSGQRLVLITFIESTIPDPIVARTALQPERGPCAGRAEDGVGEPDQLQYVIANLHRIWAS